jgi:uncharacterized protein (TIGR02996 family)
VDRQYARAAYENPRDYAPWLVYADWLDEQGHPRRAALLRHAVRSHQLYDALRTATKPIHGRPKSSHAFRVAYGRFREAVLGHDAAGDGLAKARDALTPDDWRWGRSVTRNVPARQWRPPGQRPIGQYLHDLFADRFRGTP